MFADLEKIVTLFLREGLTKIDIYDTILFSNDKKYPTFFVIKISILPREETKE